MIKLILLDLDGTLLDTNKKVSKHTMEVLKNANKLGVKIVISTGRPLHGAFHIIKTLKLDAIDSYVSAFNGALIYSLKTNSVVHQDTITGKDVKDIFKEAWPLGLDFHAFRDNHELIAQRENEYTDFECSMNHVPVTYMNILDVKDDDLFYKCMAVSEPTLLDKCIPQLEKKFSDHLAVVKSAPVFLEFNNPNATKGTGLKHLVDILGIDIKETMACGDEENDISMLEEAGIGVAMGNAKEHIKKHADFVTKTNDEDGVAYAIEKFVLGNK